MYLYINNGTAFTQGRARAQVRPLPVQRPLRAPKEIHRHQPRRHPRKHCPRHRPRVRELPSHRHRHFQLRRRANGRPAAAGGEGDRRGAGGAGELQPASVQDHQDLMNAEMTDAQSILVFLNFLTSSFFSNCGTAAPSSPSGISCPKPSMPALSRQMLSKPFSNSCVAQSMPRFSSKWQSTMILLSLFLQTQSCGRNLSVLMRVPGKFSASRMWNWSYSSGSRRSTRRKSVQMPTGSCSVRMVTEVRLEVCERASSSGLFQLQMDSAFCSWLMSFQRVEGLILRKSSPFFLEASLLLLMNSTSLTVVPILPASLDST